LSCICRRNLHCLNSHTIISSFGRQQKWADTRQISSFPTQCITHSPLFGLLPDVCIYRFGEWITCLLSCGHDSSCLMKCILCKNLQNIILIEPGKMRWNMRIFRVIYPSLTQSVAIIGFYEAYYVFTSLLLMLQVLHVIWTVMIIKILLITVRKGHVSIL